MQDVHDGEEKHHVKLSDHTVDYETINENSDRHFSPTEKEISTTNSSTPRPSKFERGTDNEKAASLDQATAYEQAYNQHVATEDGKRASSGIPNPSFEAEKDNSATGVNVPAVPLPYPPTDETLRDRSSSKADDGARIHDEDEPSPYPEGGLRAWLVVFGSFSGMTASFGVLNMSGTFQAYLSTHQLANESPSSIGWIFSLYAFLTFFCGVQIGPVFDAKGPRWLVAAGSVFLFAGMMGAAESTSMYTHVFQLERLIY